MVQRVLLLVLAVNFLSLSRSPTPPLPSPWPGDWCSPKCGATPCPTDVPAGTTAAPQCVLAIPSGSPNHCALMCNAQADWKALPVGDGGCPPTATCQPVQGHGICTYAVPPPPPPASAYSHCIESTPDCPYCIIGPNLCSPLCKPNPANPHLPLCPAAPAGAAAVPYCEYLNNGASHPTNCALICNTTGGGGQQCPTGATCAAINDPSIRLECAQAKPPTCGQCAYTAQHGGLGEAREQPQQHRVEGGVVTSSARYTDAVLSQPQQPTGAAAASNYSIVPQSNCTAALQLCYQSTLDDLQKVLKIDPVNFCHNQHATKVVQGNCAANSKFTKYDGFDPIFTSVSLWSRPLV